jgi:hypothetical protein
MDFGSRYVYLVRGPSKPDVNVAALGVQPEPARVRYVAIAIDECERRNYRCEYGGFWVNFQGIKSLCCKTDLTGGMIGEVHGSHLV